jgi:hypothetical protein
MKNETDFIGVGYPIKKRLAIGQLVKPTNRARITEQRIQMLDDGDIEGLQKIIIEYRANLKAVEEKRAAVLLKIKNRKGGHKGGATNTAVSKWRELAACAERVLAKLTGV